jgi:hypothetical protein
LLRAVVAGSGETGLAGSGWEVEEENGFADPELNGFPELLEVLNGFALLENGFAPEALPNPLEPNRVSPNPGPSFFGFSSSTFFSSLGSLDASSFHTRRPLSARMLPSLRRQVCLLHAKT